jgi:hypothetical protein
MRAHDGTAEPRGVHRHRRLLTCSSQRGGIAVDHRNSPRKRRAPQRGLHSRDRPHRGGLPQATCPVPTSGTHDKAHLSQSAIPVGSQVVGGACGNCGKRFLSFPSPVGAPLRSSTGRQSSTRLVELAGILLVQIGGLRHFCTSHCRQSRILDISEVRLDDRASPTAGLSWIPTRDEAPCRFLPFMS